MDKKIKQEVLKALMSEMDKSITEKGIKPKAVVVVEKTEKMLPTEVTPELGMESDDMENEGPEATCPECGMQMDSECPECSKGNTEDAKSFMSPRLKKLLTKK